jgi:putative ABC transport system ATP-binding protein
MSYIYLSDISKQYGEGEACINALRRVSFELQQGEFVAVVGESGSGKSTLLSIMGALNSPSGGRYTVDGIDVCSLNQDQRAKFRREFLGFIFQSFHLIPYLTAVENVMLPLITSETRKRSEKRSMAEDALARMGLAGKANRLPGEISGGEQERVAISRAIVNEPAVLLADEPTGNLDTRTSRSIMELFELLNEEGMTIVMVTHSPDCADVAHRVLKVSDGRLIEDIRRRTSN